MNQKSSHHKAELQQGYKGIYVVRLQDYKLQVEEN
jgi:hypothetical protein